MEVQSAVELVNQVIYKPGWNFEAEPHTPRFEGTISVCITYPAADSGSNSFPEAWRDGFLHLVPGGAKARHPIVVSDVDDVGLYKRLIDVILDIEEHEAREFLRILPTGWAPFHPHRVDGMRRWGKMEHDLHFGLS